MTAKDKDNYSTPTDAKHLFDNPRNVKRLLVIFYFICGVLFALDFVVHRHIVHPWENLWGFYPLYGFAGCVLLVLVAKWMRSFLMRDENYYDKEELHNFDEQDSQQKG